jgi:ankyrin repeat protein
MFRMLRFLNNVSKQYPHFKNLTDDAKQTICTFLDPISLYYFGCTNKANNAVATSKLLWQPLLNTDEKINQLIDLVKGFNDKSLNKYIFNCLKKDNTKLELIYWGILLDQYDKDFEKILYECDHHYFLDDDLPYLYIATRLNSLNSAELLLKTGADPDYVSEMTPHALYIAAKEGKHEIVDVLLKYHANTEVTFDNCTALSIAASEGHVKVVERLLDAGAHVNCHPNPLILAIENNKDGVVNILLDYSERTTYAIYCR